MSALALLAEEQARLDAAPRPVPPATWDEVSALAAHVEAQAQAALWGGVVNLWRLRSREARRLYALKRVLWGRRAPGPYLRGEGVQAPPPKMHGGGTNAGAQALAAQRAARLHLAQQALDGGASMAEAAAVAGYRSAHVLRTVIATERARIRRAAS